MVLVEAFLIEINRNWSQYREGFGETTGEYWLGLRHIHFLTTTPSTLRIEMETFGDVTPVSAFAEYSNFSVGSEMLQVRNLNSLQMTN